MSFCFRFEFSNGTVLTAQELVARGFDINGGSGDETLRATKENDRIDGGAGNDTLQGGLGNDTYLFGAGSGKDTISDIDTLRINANGNQVTIQGWISDPTNDHEWQNAA